MSFLASDITISTWPTQLVRNLNDITLECRDLFDFQLRSIRSSPRDLILSCWETRMGGEQLGLSWQLESICRIFNVYDLYRRSSSAIRRIVARLYQSMLIALGHPKSALETLSITSSRCVLSRNSFLLAYWNLHCWLF